MKQTNNTPTVLVHYKGSPTRMTTPDIPNQCKFCGSEERLVFVGIIPKNSEDVGIEEDKAIRLCEKHYRKIMESKEYRVRELPEPTEFKRNQRFVVDGNKVVLLQPENEKEWIQFSKEDEKNLSGEV